MQRTRLVFTDDNKRDVFLILKIHCIHTRCDNALPSHRLRPRRTSVSIDPPAATHIDTPLGSEESPTTRHNPQHMDIPDLVDPRHTNGVEVGHAQSHTASSSYILTSLRVHMTARCTDHSHYLLHREYFLAAERPSTLS